jgi:anti-sigma factor RsiW
MKCIEAARYLSEEMDGRLKPTLVSQLRSHLESCSACRELAAVLKETSRLVSLLEREAPSDGFEEVLRHKLKIATALEIERPICPRVFRDLLVDWFLKPAALAAVIALAAFGLAKMAPVPEPPMFAEASSLVEAIDKEYAQHDAAESMMDDAALTLWERVREQEREGSL